MIAIDAKDGLSPAKRDLLRARLRGKSVAAVETRKISPRPQFQNPLSFGQERIWFDLQINPKAAHYRIPLLVRLNGRLDVGALERSLNAVIRRHEVLRSGFRNEGGAPVLTLTPDAELTLHRLDLSDDDIARQEARLSERAAAEVVEPFDLARPPLMRATLVALGQERSALLLTIHHIVWDGWSSVLLIREIREFYAAFSTGSEPNVAALDVQYTDFAYWQRQLLANDSGNAQIAYWKSQLSGLAPVSSLPTDRPRQAAQRHKGAAYAWTLPEPMRRRLLDLGRSSKTTLFVTLLSAFITCLRHYTHQDDVAIGTTIAYRTRPEFEKLMGFFTNVLVIRAALADNPSFKRLVSRVHDLVLAAQENQDAPFEKLVDEIAPKRDLSHNPLFQIGFVLHNLPNESLVLPGLDVAIEELSVNASAFDLVLHFFDEPGRLRARFEYDADLFDEVTVIRLARYFETLTALAVSDPEMPIDALSPLGAADHAAVLTLSRGAPLRTRDERLLHELIPSNHRIAVSSSGASIDYVDLARRSNRVAHYLKALGVRPDTVVGVVMKPSVDAVVAILGVLKAGGAYAPIDPAYPRERIRHITFDANVRVIVSTESLAEALPALDVPLVVLNRDSAAIDNMPETPPETQTHPDNLAYVIYTSGSTGAAKGVMVSHRNAVASLFARREYYVGEVSSYLLLSSLAFDSSVAGLFWTLSQGGRLCAPDDELRRDPAGLARLMQEEAVSHLLALPSLYDALLAILTQEAAHTLRCAIVAGEECKPDVAARHRACLPNASFFNEYGPTECAVWSSVSRVSQAPIGIGRPIPGTKIYLLQSNLTLAPIGAIGEIAIGGAGVARGYRNRPELSAERFIPNFVDADGSRLYRTGDIGRWRNNGELEFLGRIDNQVKIRGYRIELGEVEAALLAHPQISEVIGVAQPCASGGDRLLAYATTQGTSPAAEKDLKQFLSSTLPDFMIPVGIIHVDRFPRLPNGKIDRSALPDVELAQRGDNAQGRSLTAAETLVAEIWREILSVGDIRPSDNFFDLGGNSLSAIQVIARLQQLIGGDLPVTSLFDAPSLEDFTAEIEAANVTSSRDEDLEALLTEFEQQKSQGAISTGAENV